MGGGEVIVEKVDIHEDLDNDDDDGLNLTFLMMTFGFVMISSSSACSSEWREQCFGLKPKPFILCHLV